MKELEEIKKAYEEKRKVELELWDFERHVRHTIIEDLLKQSNAQKIQLTFEKQAQRGENGNTWRNLQQQVKNAEVRYVKAQWDYEVALENLKNG